MAASNTSFELRSETFCTKHLRRRRRAKLIAQSTNTDGCCVLRRSRCAEGHVQNLNRAFLEGKCSSAYPAIVRPLRGDVRKAAACGLSRGQGPPGPLSSREVIIGNRAGFRTAAPACVPNRRLRLYRLRLPDLDLARLRHLEQAEHEGYCRNSDRVDQGISDTTGRCVRRRGDENGVTMRIAIG